MLAVYEDGWIADGQYTGALDGDVLEKAHTLVWLELPFHTIFWRTFLRTIRRARDKERICGDNYESCVGRFSVAIRCCYFTLTGDCSTIGSRWIDVKT